jgi:hypothetical protein
MEQDSKKPNCFIPEDNAAYPLCTGNGSEECEKCQLWTDYPDSYYAGLEG